MIGASAGGLAALRVLLGALDLRFAWPLVTVMHIAEPDISGLVSLLGRTSVLPVREAHSGEALAAGVWLAPGNYHLLIERDAKFALSVDARVAHARPSIDVLFESAADSFAARVIGVVLSGANDDGARGLAAIRAAGGLALVQDPDSAEEPTMPRAALQRCGADAILTPALLAARLQHEFDSCQTRKR